MAVRCSSRGLTSLTISLENTASNGEIGTEQAALVLDHLLPALLAYVRPHALPMHLVCEGACSALHATVTCVLCAHNLLVHAQAATTRAICCMPLRQRLIWYTMLPLALAPLHMGSMIAFTLSVSCNDHSAILPSVLAAPTTQHCRDHLRRQLCAQLTRGSSMQCLSLPGSTANTTGCLSA